MGADIHWYLERRHGDGQWEAVLSKGFYYHTVRPHLSWSDTARAPQLLFGLRSYEWFAMLSGVRGNPLPGLGPIARPGVPDDASDFIKCNLGSDNCDLHSHGWFSLADMEAWPERVTLEGGLRKDDRFAEAMHQIEFYTLVLRNILLPQHSLEVSVDNILVGPEYCSEYEVAFPTMTQESAHERLQRQHRISGLLPLAPDSLRVIVAYDN